MRKPLILSLSGIVLAMLIMSFTAKKKEQSIPVNDQYIVIAWNDLGMHCSNLDFSNMCILPPYNNQKVHVIKRGSQTTLPVVMTGLSGIHVTYEIPGNTQSATKTNFWTYCPQLFGVSLPTNIGLTGFGMTGIMIKTDTTNFQYTDGIPITAFPDATPAIADPYQLTLIKAYSATNQLLATTQSVIPVSHEINCVSAGCHSSEMNILQMHEQVPGFNINNRPIFCANCHSDNALGKPGTPGVDPFSQVIHEKHGEFIKTGTNTDCYKCHPGPNTQCWRDIMHSSTGAVSKCQDCHGSVKNVGKTIEQGRNPWLQEPSCGAIACHGPTYAEEPGKLFRQSKGHGGLFCSTCHSSPHAILPTTTPQDNVQNIALQGFAGTLKTCSVCHGYTPIAPGPHGIVASNNTLQNVTISNGQTRCYDATNTITVAGNNTTFIIADGGSATLIAGQRIQLLPGLRVFPGGYFSAYLTTNGQYCGSIPGAVSGPLGEAEQTYISEQERSFFTIYPNPTQGKFTLILNASPVESKTVVKIYNLLGYLVLQKDIINKTTGEFNIHSLPSGIYLISIMQSGLTGTAKIVKQ